MSGWPVLALAAPVEGAVAMPLLPGVLKYGANRRATILVSVASIEFVAFTLPGETQRLFCIFLAAVEIVRTLLIVRYAWSWPDPDGKTRDAVQYQGEPGASI